MSKTKRQWLPEWNMPSDPVKAVFWFMHWLLKVLVRYFWLPILIMIAYETYVNGSRYGIANGAVGGLVTLGVGLIVWGMLYLILLFFKVSNAVSNTISEVNRMQQGLYSRRPYSPFAERESEPEGPIVEGSIITDLEEERKKRRRE